MLWWAVEHSQLQGADERGATTKMAGQLNNKVLQQFPAKSDQ